MQAAQKKMLRSMRRLMWFGVMVGIGGFVGGVWSYQSQLSSRGWPTAPGTILNSSVVQTWDGGRTEHSADVLYSYTVNGLAHQSKQIALWSSDLSYGDAVAFVHSHPSGASVVVYYEPGDANNSCLVPGPHAWVDLLAMGTGLFLLLTCGGAIYGISGKLAMANAQVHHTVHAAHAKREVDKFAADNGNREMEGGDLAEDPAMTNPALYLFLGIPMALVILMVLICGIWRRDWVTLAMAVGVAIVMSGALFYAVSHRKSSAFGQDRKWMFNSQGLLRVYPGERHLIRWEQIESMSWGSVTGLHIRWQEPHSIDRSSEFGYEFGKRPGRYVSTLRIHKDQAQTIFRLAGKEWFQVL